MAAQPKKRSTMAVGLSPKPVPVVPITSFTKRHVSSQVLEDAWLLCGPSVEKHIHRLPMWKVIALAYMEGALHGAQATELMQKEQEIMAASFVPRSSLGREFNYIFEVQEREVNGVWKMALETNDRTQAVARAASIENGGGISRIVDNSK